jgi:epidermal growth factor receptor substrate 15
VPPLSPEKVNEYVSLFEKSGAENGLLPGVVAKQIFERARLPNEVLGRIWNLADTQGRGALDPTEFAIAMHLLASCKTGTMRGVPQTLPAGLYEAAAKRTPIRTSTGSQKGSGIPPVPGIPAQFTGMSSGRPQSPMTRQQVGTPLSAQSTGDGWAITPADKARFDQIFAGLDKPNRGFITGDQAVEFFGNARLPEEILAQIWDLADINSEGQLNRDEFAVAMYLIRQQRGTKEGRGNLPTTLPPSLVPPMMRKQQAPPSQPTAPAFENAPVTKPKSAADDLFGLDAFAAPSQVPQSTGGSQAGGPFQNPKSPPPPPRTSSPVPSTNFKPFVPSSSFGQSIAPQQTGFSQSQNRGPPPSASDDLLGDADPEVSQKLTSETSELANLSNQVGTLSKQMQEVQSNRATVEQEFSQSSQQKKEFEVRLSQLRTMYEKEVKDLKALQEQRSTQLTELTRLQQDIAMLEGGRQDVRNQRQQVATALDADLREKAALTEKMKAMNAEMNELKPQVEKMKSEARQQKGLVAINRKQLASLEAERERLQEELNTAKTDLDTAKREADEQARSAPQSSTVMSPVNVASPAASTMSANNPFFRRGTGTSETFSPPPPSREQTTDHRDAFDAMFGPSIAAPTSSTPPPVSFQNNSSSESRQATESEVTSPGSPPPTSSPNGPNHEPPAPPKSRQITSAALPFRAPLTRADSISSSVKVAPPASRLSPADTPRANTPSASTPSYSQRGESPVQAGPATADQHDETSRSLPREQATPTIGAVEPPNQSAPSSIRSSSQEIPGAFPRSATPRSEVPPATAAAAAAAGAGAAGLAAGVTAAAMSSQDAEKGKSVGKQPGDLDANFDRYFGGPAHSRSPSQKAADFDSAFADFKPPTANGTAGVTGNEFPPIRELEDDDSDDSSEAPKGFDDDFTAASPPRPPKEKEPEQQNPEVAAAVPSSLQVRPQFNTVPSTNSSLPEIEAQKSPPTYGESVPHDDPNQFPPEFKGLLPHRGDPTSPTNEPPHSVDHETGLPAGRSFSQPYAPEASRSPPLVADSGPAPSTATPPPKKLAEDDFDAAFSNMTPAPAADEDDEDDLDTAFSNHNTTDFDPTFDSPAPSKSTTATMPTAAAPSSHFSTTAEPTSTQNINATNDFYNFSSNVNDSHPPAAATTQPTTSTPNTFKDSDWDDMFAALDTPPAPTTIASEPPTSTTHDPADQIFSPPPGPPPNHATANLSAAPTTAKEASPSPPPASSAQQQFSAPSATKTQRPVPGRALSGGTEHDDPILKRLTAMGWSRDESLRALERFDYNIDKVSPDILQGEEGMGEGV